VALHVRPYRPCDRDATIAIFLAAIRQTAARDYEPAQIAAWAQVPDPDGWDRRRQSRPTWLAWHAGEHGEERPAGFSDLEPDGHLDMMFVDPAYGRSGVATLLLSTIEAAARWSGLPRLFTEASLTARPFFARCGFVVLAAQQVTIRGVPLRNFRMEKRLGAPPRSAPRQDPGDGAREV